jgi:hypothetical protein
MRAPGVRSLSVTCELCHHEAVMNVDAFDDAVAVPAFGPRMVCTANARAGIQFSEHIEGDGAAIFAHACKLGCEGIVSKHRTHPYRSGPSKVWLKIKNPSAPGVLRFEDRT